jgi:1-deoxy-D-xylulose-5-phosphate synthase
VALLSLGTRLTECLAAADMLEAAGISVTVADARFAKPLDSALIEELVLEHQAMITIEEGASGGFGALVLHHLADSNLLRTGAAIRTMTLPDRFMEQASPSAMYEAAGLNARHIFENACLMLGVNVSA